VVPVYRSRWLPRVWGVGECSGLLLGQELGDAAGGTI
jgi:hypothetical protein